MSPHLQRQRNEAPDNVTHKTAFVVGNKHFYKPRARPADPERPVGRSRPRTPLIIQGAPRVSRPSGCLRGISSRSRFVSLRVVNAAAGPAHRDDRASPGRSGRQRTTRGTAAGHGGARRGAEGMNQSTFSPGDCAGAGAKKRVPGRLCVCQGPPRYGGDLLSRLVGQYHRRG